MNIALAAYETRNRDLTFNLRQIERGLRETQGKADLLCFGEAFLQGFDALCWDFARDKAVAVSTDSEVFRRLAAWTVRYGVDLLFGYLEREGEAIYSSCAVIASGRLVHNYHRISEGWREPWADEHYREGDGVSAFRYRDRELTIALCGDLWTYPERFRTDGLLIWPIYVTFDLEAEAAAYAKQAALAAKCALLVNPLSGDPVSHGGAFFFQEGQIVKRLPFDAEGMLIVEV